MNARLCVAKVLSLFNLSALALVLVGAMVGSADPPPDSGSGRPAEGAGAAQSREPIDFDRQVRPVLERSCANCHSGEEPQGELLLATRDSLLKGGASGPVVVEGKSDESLLIELVSGADPDRVMPAKGKRLTAEEVSILRGWIDQGLTWPRTIRIAAAVKTDLKLRRPDVPSASAKSEVTHPVDLFLAGYFARHGVSQPTVVADATFARRVHLDLIGLLPPVERLIAFEAETRPDKRERMVRQLLNDRRAYAEHWLSFWNDALRNEYRGTGFIDGGRQQITGWLYQALYENKPYDRFVHELVDPVPGSEGFLHGIQWRGAVNASQRREMQAAQTIAQVFMGTTLKCASCHDSFVNHWRLVDAYALASVFAEEPLEIHRCDQPIDRTAEPRFIYPQLGTINAKVPHAERRRQLADILTSEENGRLARTIVNRLWARLFGRGLIDPLDDMDQPAWHPKLLDWLAADLVDHDYDLKHTLEVLCTSRAYRLTSVRVDESDTDADGFVFRGPVPKRMSAEQFVDALAMLTGNWQDRTGAMLRVDGRGQGGQLAAVQRALGIAWRAEDHLPGKWIWNESAAKGVPPGRVYFRKTFTLDEKPQQTRAVVSCDNEFVLYVNGTRVAVGKDWSVPVTVDLTASLREGSNTIAVLGVNEPDSSPQKPAKKAAKQSDVSSAGLFLMLEGSSEGLAAWRLATDETWLCSDREHKGWTNADFETAGWDHAVEIGDPDAAPWRLGDLLAGAMFSADDPIRASLGEADPLMRALGRPNREQLVTRRESVATTLQAMELTNGGTLAEVLKSGATFWAERAANGPDALIEQVYLASLGRKPAPAELAAARELLGDAVTNDGIEDLLWVILMLPEFQLY